MSSLEIIGKRLSTARQSAGLDLAALASSVGISTEALGAFESGREPLSISALVKVASLLRVPPGTFVHEVAPDVLPPTTVAKMLRAQGSAELAEGDSLLLDRAVDVARVFLELGSIVGEENLALRFKPMPARKTKPYEQGYQAAARVRQLLNEPTAPLTDLRGLIEDRFGTLVIFRPLSAAVLGVACRAGDARVVAVSSAARETSRRFTLAHELAHVLFDLGDGRALVDVDPERFSLEKPPSEKRADAFAAMALAPRAGIEELLGKPNGKLSMSEARRVVGRARRHFGMGFIAMAWHLRNLGFFAEAVAKALEASPDPSNVEGFEDVMPNAVERRVRLASQLDLISEARAAAIRNLAAFLQ